MPASEVLDMPSGLKTIPIKKYSQSGKRMPPLHLAQKFSPLHNLKCPYAQKFFWQSIWHFSSLHTFCGKQQSQQLTWQTTKSVTRFFQTKAMPPALWNACDYVLQFNFKIAHIAGSVNTAADFLSRLELKVTEKIRLKIREDIQTIPIEVTTSSSDVADEEHFFFTHADDSNESEEQTLERKERWKQNAKQWTANEESPVLKTSMKEFTKIDGNTTSYSMNRIKTNARIRVEQEVDLVLKNMKSKIFGQPHDEVLMMTDSRYKNYKANEDRIILEDGLLFRKYFGETGSVKYYQIRIPKQLVNEFLRNQHGQFGNHPGIYKTIIAYREKYYFLKMAQLIREWESEHVSNKLENHKLTVASPGLSCKTQISTILRPETPCKLIWWRSYRHLVAMKTLWQPWMCFPAICLHTRHQIRTPKQLLQSQLTSWLRTPTYQRRSSQINVQPLRLT